MKSQKSTQICKQRLHKLEILKLKSIKDVCISFESENITGILGPNGYGKSTILHALACCFQPPTENRENYKFSNFFLSNPDALWSGSELKITHTYRQSSQLHENVEQTYAKSSDRWKPIYKRRPTRNIIYFGIDSCVPLIEAEKRNVKINYSTQNVSEDIITTILEKASFCLNKKYTAYNVHDSGRGRKFIGVEANGIRYSALSMSAGEQKIFILLEKIFKADKNSLILIDELDLLLHDSALKNLITVVLNRAKEKDLQVIFTTHRESVLELSDLINVRHISGTTEKTFCFNDTKPDAIYRLTGKQQRLLEVFVEDDLAVAIVNKIASQLGIHKHVSVVRFGAAINCFTILAGLCLRGQNFDESIFVLDGDVYRTKEKQEERIKAILTGEDEKAKSLRGSSLEKIKCLNLPENIKPEKYIHRIIIGLENSDDDEHNEIIEVAKQVMAVNDDHKYVNDIIDRLNWSRDVGLSKIVDVISSTQEWADYTAEIRDWLILKKKLVDETTS